MVNAEQLKALAEPTRFAIVQLLLDRHHCSRSLATALGISESAVSQHMSVLKDCGLVRGARRGYRIHYSVDRGAVLGLKDGFGSWIARMDGVQECCKGNLCPWREQDGCCSRGKRRAACSRDGKTA